MHYQKQSNMQNKMKEEKSGRFPFYLIDHVNECIDLPLQRHSTTDMTVVVQTNQARRSTTSFCSSTFYPPLDGDTDTEPLIDQATKTKPQKQYIVPNSNPRFLLHNGKQSSHSVCEL